MNGQQLKNSILQLAIQGKLVPQDPNDEPASVLLRKIRKEKEQLVKAGKLKKKDLVCTPIADEEKPFEIPEGWEWVRLSDYVMVVTDGDHSAPPQCEKGIPFVVISCIDDETINFDRAKQVLVSYYEGLEESKKPQKGDILFTVTGSYGKVIELKNDCGFCFQRHIALIRPFFGQEYLAHMLRSSYIKSECDEKATGIAQKTVVLSVLRNLLIPLPPLSEQHRIVAKIEELMPFVSEYDKAQSKLDELNDRLPSILKKSILQEAIMGKLVPQDPNDEPASALLSKIRKEKEQLVKAGKLKKKDLVSTPIAEEEKPFEIPESWEWCRLGDLVSNRAGLAYAKSDLDIKQNPLITVLRGGNISFGSWTYKDDDVKISKQFVNDELLLKKGTFITPAVTSLENMGKTALIENNCEDTVVGGFVLMLTPHLVDIPCSRFLLHLFNGSYFKESCKKITNKSGQAFYNISRAKMMDILIPLPPLPEQHRIVSKIEELFCVLE